MLQSLTPIITPIFRVIVAELIMRAAKNAIEAIDNKLSDKDEED